MKKLFIMFLLLELSFASFSQQTNHSKALTKQNYQQKSKHQKTAAWVLLGSGGILFITGYAIPQGETTGITIYPTFDYTHKNDGIKAVFWISGTLSMVSSIPLFLASGRNKRKAMAISASGKMEDANMIQGYSMLHIHFPAISVKINL